MKNYYRYIQIDFSGCFNNRPRIIMGNMDYIQNFIKLLEINTFLQLLVFIKSENHLPPCIQKVWLTDTRVLGIGKQSKSSSDAAKTESALFL